MHNFVDCNSFRAGHDLAGHDIGDRTGENGCTPLTERSHNIALRNNPCDLPAGVGNDEGADVLLC